MNSIWASYVSLVVLHVFLPTKATEKIDPTKKSCSNFKNSNDQLHYWIISIFWFFYVRMKVMWFLHIETVYGTILRIGDASSFFNTASIQTSWFHSKKLLQLQKLDWPSTFLNYMNILIFWHLQKCQNDVFVEFVYE